MKFLLYILLAIFIGNTTAYSDSFDRNLIVLDASRNDKVKQLFDELVYSYKNSEFNKFEQRVSEDKFIGDYSLFIDAVEEDIRNFDIHSIFYTVDSIVSSGYDNNPARILSVEWVKTYENNKGSSLLKLKRKSVFTFDEENGKYKLIKVAGDLLFGSSSGELRTEIGNDGEGKKEKADLEIVEIITEQWTETIGMKIKNNGDESVSKEFSCSLEVTTKNGDKGYIFFLVENDVELGAGETIEVSSEEGLDNIEFIHAIAIVDSENDISESNEDNNIFKDEIQFARTNLIVQYAGLKSISSSNNQIEFEPQNDGTTMIHGFEYKIVYDRLDGEQEEVIKEYSDDLKAGEKILIFDTFPFDTKYYKGAKIFLDPNNEIEEIVEQDNTISLEAINPMDIVPSDLEIEENSIKFTISNEGAYSFKWFSYVIKYTLDDGEEIVIEKNEQTNSFKVPNPGESIEITQEIDSSEVNIVNAQISISALDEVFPPAKENNELEGSRNFNKTDLEVVNIHARDYTSSGSCDANSFIVEINNNGRSKVENVSLKLSYTLNNAEVQTKTIENIELDVGENDIEVDAFENYSFATQVSVEAIIDPEDEISETKISNNKKYQTFRKKINLSIEDIIAPDYSTGECNYDEIKIIVKNSGENSACGVNVKLDYILNDSDQLEETLNIEENGNIDDDTSKTYKDSVHGFCEASKTNFVGVVTVGDIEQDTFSKEYSRDIDLELVSLKALGLDESTCSSNKVQVVVRNNGEDKAFNEDIKLFYTLDEESENENTEIGKIITLDANEEKEYLLSLDDNYCDANKIVLRAIVDPDESTTDTDRSNNEKSKTTVGDLAISNIYVSKEEMRFDIVNNTQNDIYHMFDVDIEYKIDDNSKEQLLRTTISSLDAGASHTVTKSIANAQSATSITVYINIDPNNNIFEFDETNNEEEFTQEFESVLPDLTITSMVKEGSTMNFTVTSSNARSNTNRYSIECISMTSVSGEIVNGDISLMNRNESLSISHEYIEWLDSCQNIKIIVDIDEEIEESNEENNERTEEYTYVRPDLTVANITKEDESSISFDVRNINNIAGPNKYKVDCLDNANFVKGDINQLNADDTQSITISNLDWLATCYSIKVIVDVDTQVLEDDESNNEETLDFTRPSPDLSVISPNCIDEDSMSFIVESADANAPTSNYEVNCIAFGATVTGAIGTINKDDEVSITVDNIMWLSDCASIKITVDVNDVIQESDEDNNEINGFSCTAPKEDK